MVLTDNTIVFDGSVNVVDAGVGNDTYILSPYVLAPGSTIQLSDADNKGSLQLVSGLKITQSEAYATALRLTLADGSVFTILDADQLTYEPSGNKVAGVDNADISYASFVRDILGISGTLGNTTPRIGGAVTIGGNLPPTISDATAVSAVVGQAIPLPDMIFEDFDSSSLTVTVTANNGVLGGLIDADPATAEIQLIGSPAAVTTAFNSATFTGTIAGSGKVNLSVSDGVNAAVTASIPVTIDTDDQSANKVVLFRAYDGTSSYANPYWVTNGTASSTYKVNFTNNYLPNSSGFTQLPQGKVLLFYGSEGYPYVTDGTDAGTFSVSQQIGTGIWSTFQKPVILPNQSVIFSATTKDSSLSDDQLWLTDGITTTFLKKFSSTPLSMGYGYDHAILSTGKLLFDADDGSHGHELWITDGTANGTALVKDITVGSGRSYINGIATLANGKAVFQSSMENDASGPKLWVTDGTENGTQIIRQKSNGNHFISLNNGKALFIDSGELHATDVSDADVFGMLDLQSLSIQALWMTDGSSLGTVSAQNYFITSWPGLYPIKPLEFPNGQILFSANGVNLTVQNGVISNPYGMELWITDSNSGTHLVKDIYPGSDSSNASNPVLLTNGKALFTANDGVHGIELWITDGTTNGTYLVKDIRPGIDSSEIASITALQNGKALFTANDGIHGFELWVTDGTESGTSLVRDINPASGMSSNPTSLAEVTLLGISATQ